LQEQKGGVSADAMLPRHAGERGIDLGKAVGGAAAIFLFPKRTKTSRLEAWCSWSP
jgi:hypothetical protein